MYVLTVSGQEGEGAYAVTDPDGERALYLFLKEDDAERYAMMLNEQEKGSFMNVIEIEDSVAIRTCKQYNYKYAVITPNDIVVPPPNNDNVSKN